MTLGIFGWEMAHDHDETKYSFDLSLDLSGYLPICLQTGVTRPADSDDPTGDGAVRTFLPASAVTWHSSPSHHDTQRP